jgi:hypothetical protein
MTDKTKRYFSIRKDNTTKVQQSYFSIWKDKLDNTGKITQRKFTTA